jgi:hypothetical protein
MSKPTDAQWAEIMRLHLVDGIGVRELSKRFGVPASTIQSRTKTAQIAQVKSIANQMVDVNQQFAQLDNLAQNLTATLASKLCSISSLSADVAESEAVSAKRLSAIKSVQILNLDPESPDCTTVALIKVLGDTVNDALKPAFNLLSANKAFIEKQNEANIVTQKYARIERVIVDA